MSDTLREYALTVAELLPKLMRRLFELDMDDPASDLPVAQLRVCGILREGPKPISCLSRELGISLSAATQLADRLEKSGLVERVIEEDDRRVKCLQLTSQGCNIMAGRMKKRIDRVEQALMELGPEEPKAIILALQKLLNAGVKIHGDNRS